MVLPHIFILKKIIPCASLWVILFLRTARIINNGGFRGNFRFISEKFYFLGNFFYRFLSPYKTIRSQRGKQLF